MRSPRCRLALILLGLLAAIAPLRAADPLADGFANPPDAAKPITFWQWMNGCVTREGITSDLESFKRAGLGGVQQFLIGGSEAEITDPTIQVLNPKWNELMKFAMSECARLGLSFGTHNCPGWSSSGSPGVKVEDSMQKLVWAKADFTGPGSLPGKLARPAVDPRWNYYRDIAVFAVPAKGDIPAGGLIDLTDKLRPDDSLNWTAPAGDWAIYRLGQTTTGQVNGTGPVSGQGLEVDKMSREALERFWKTYPEKIIALAGELAGKTFVRFEIDSYEAGLQDWTPAMREEFRQRRGHDLLPWLPVLVGRTVGDRDQTARFREDWRQTINDLFAENYYGYATELTNRVPGMKLMIEPYGTGHAPFTDGMQLGRKGDLLASEFWADGIWGWSSVKPVTSSTHTNGGVISMAEAFTGRPTFGWRTTPHDLRTVGDRAFALGVNQFVLHAAAHQPWPEWKPGMTMGYWGTQFGSGQTWWEHGGPDWLRYVTRSQYLLQQGLFSGDICWVLSEHNRPPAFPRGYDGDFIARQTLIDRLHVKDGRLVLPTGQSYGLLVLENQPAVAPELARKIRQLVAAGATILGPKPTRAPGLRDFPAADREVAKIGDEVWGEGDGKTPREHAFGKGRILWGMTLEQALAAANIEPDVQFAADAPLVWIHRKVGAAEIWLVSNQKDAAITADVSFRISGFVPELWHAETGLIEPAPVWKSENGRTTVPLSLASGGSTFVVFRKPAGKIDSIASITPSSELSTTPDGVKSLVARTAGDYLVKTAAGKSRTLSVKNVPAPLAIDGPWELAFPPKSGAPEKITLDRLISWPESPDAGVKYFSGTATYRKSLDVPAALLTPNRVFTLDLGRVENIAEVFLNGQSAGTLWNPPFRVDVTPLLKAGRNDLEIRVTNLWPNRLIGDEQLPNDLDWSPNDALFLKKPVGRHLHHAPDWLANPAARTTGRVTFTTFKFFDAKSPLLDSGLLGPVKLETAEKIPLPAFAAP